MVRIAMITTGPLLNPMEDARNANYGALADQIFAELDARKGFLGMSPLPPDKGWGKWVIPVCYQKEEYKNRIIQTLSVWQDLESMAAYSYHGVHAQALKRRAEWFPDVPLPNHALWWIDDEHQPTWAEAAARYDRIVDEGVSPSAFNMRELYDAKGQSVKLNQERLKSLAKLYRQ